METVIISTLFVLGHSFEFKAHHATVCEHDWRPFEDSCYKFIEKKVDWYEARNKIAAHRCVVYNMCDYSRILIKYKELFLICKKIGSHLVRIETGEEDEFVAKIAKHYRSSTWIGLTGAMVEGHYVWADNKQKPKYKHWMRGQPNNYWKTDDCTYLSRKHHYLWVDAPCDNIYSSICEKQALFVV